jgi:transcriptional regulator
MANPNPPFAAAERRLGRPMYLPSHFEETRSEVLRAFMREHPLGTIVVSDGGSLSADHVPLHLRPDQGPRGTLIGHVARANPLWRKAATAGDGGLDALVLFQGTQHYISPGWYASKAKDGRVVPTWNYAVVHVHGRMKPMDDGAWLRGMLEELTGLHEAGRSPPWRMDDAPEDYVAKMMRAIVGIEIEILGLVGKFKLSQNKSAQDQDSMIHGLLADGSPEAAEMAGVMRSQRQDS